MTEQMEEVIKAALQLERDGRQFYLDTAEKTSSDTARKMFESLAQDELTHIEWIENLSPGAHTAETANRKLYERLKHIFTDVPDGVRLAAELSDDDLEAIGIALGMEERSIEAYDKWAQDTDRENVKKLCEVLSRQEHFHCQVLNNTREYIDRTADWFMKEEQWSFEGA